ncbi:MAG: NPCBM/NEW2 domain-containing protein [Pirellulales bacterium]|nr:NPCBM/NEW2 domain-containing protein [Pirellulales bacterium]
MHLRGTIVATLVLAASCLWGCCCALAEPLPLLRVGQDQAFATLLRSTSADSLEFRIGEQSEQVTLQELVRWSAPRVRGGQPAVVLTDGSHLVLADSWSGNPAVELGAERVRVKTKLFGDVSFSRELLRAILRQTPVGLVERAQFLEELLEPQAEDRMMMSSGDMVAGRCLEIGTTIRFATGQVSTNPLSNRAQTVPLELPLDERVAAVAFASPAKNGLQQRKEMVVGLRDGTLLVAQSLIANADNLQVQLACGQKLTGRSVDLVESLRSRQARVSYLSDRVESAYRHVPYLEIPWPEKRDRNVLGGPLTVAGRSYAKGLGMHSASRLTFDLPTPEKGEAEKHVRFRAQIALDEAAAKLGSVVFSVYLSGGAGFWEQAYQSPILRGGESPQGVSVELGSARQIALVADYADQGDQCDYANWIDARLE